MRNIWFTSDTHFGHGNIIKYTNRPFKSCKEHDSTLVENWNSVVQPEDTIYHLGDFGFGSPGFLNSILKQLNGNIHIVWGNHDKTTKRLKESFASYQDYLRLKFQDSEIDGTAYIILSHYAFEVWDKKHFGSIHLHGHSHGTLSPRGARLDVGIDSINSLGFGYRPISYNEIKIYFTKLMLNEAT